MAHGNARSVAEISARNTPIMVCGVVCDRSDRWYDTRLGI